MQFTYIGNKLMALCIFMFSAWLAPHTALAQPNITRVEYFIDTDPGFDKATSITIGSASNIADQMATIPLGSLAAGIHNLYLRSKDANGKWSVTNRATFYRTNLGGAGLTNIVRAEYFIDNDPGFGAATSLGITPAIQIADQAAIINLNSVGEGIHNLYIRAQDATGKWSVTNRATFYRGNLNSTTLPNITKAEYFIDTDPGFGAGTNIPVSSSANIANKEVTINLSGIEAGIHNLYIRTQDVTGKWSVTNRATFFRGNLNNTTLPNITKAEYFIDTDPGFGAATNIPVSSSANIADKEVTINLSGTEAGIHNLYIRTQDATGKWSVTNWATFYRGNLSNATLTNITKAEYFIDTDPGFGAGTNIPISSAANIADKEVTINLSGIEAGIHNLYIRTQDATGKWSISNRATFFRPGGNAALPNIVKAEYFIDTDPGFGQGINIPVTSGTNIADAVVSVSLTGLTSGLHYLFLRSQDAKGSWSITNLGSFAAGSGVALKFDGSDDFVNAGNIFAEQIFTVDMWVKPGTTQTSYANIIDNNHRTNINWVCQQDQNSTNNYYFASKGIVNFSLLPDVWQHLTLVQGTASMAVYVDGVLKGSIDNTISSINYSNPFIYLAGHGGGGRHWNGEMDEVRLWSRALGAAEVAAAGCQKFVNGNPLFANLEAYYSFNEASGNTGFDNSGNNRNATLQNGVARVNSNIACLLTGPDRDGDGTSDADDCAPDDITKWQSENLFVDNDNDGYDAGKQDVCYGATIPAGFKKTTLGTDCADNDGTINVRQSFTVTGATNVCVGNQNYSIGNSQASIIYTWSLPTGGNLSPATGTSTTVNWTNAGSHVLTAKASRACPLDSFATLSITVTAGVPVIAPGIVVSNRTLTATALASGATGWQWFKNDIIVNGATGQSITVGNTESGNYTVAYANTCGTGNASTPVAIAIAKTDQTITFTPVPAKTFGDAAFEVTATASSALPISAYSLVSGPATMSGNTITITGAGTITVKATQEGNGTFNAAENTLQIEVAKAAATIVLSNLTAIYDGIGKQAAAATNPLGLNFALAYNGSATLPVSAGDYNVLATITSANYQGSTMGTLAIGKAGQSINLTNPGNKSYNDIPFGVTATSTSGLPVSLSIQTVPAAGVASIAGNTITLLGQGGTVTITAAQAGNTNYNPATNATASFDVRPPEAKDLQITTLLSPLNGCTLGVLGDITIRLRNTGTLPASGFPVSYRIGSDPVVVETFTGTIAPGANADFTFATKGIFAQTGVNYQLTLNVNLTGDEIPGNNTLLSSVARFAPATMSISSDTAICAGGEAILKTFGAGNTQWTGGPANATYKVSPLVTTTYTARVTDVNGCKTETFTVKVTVNANPVVDAGPDQTILRGSSTTLTASGAVSYLWNNGITTAENTVSPQATTNYSVTGTNAAGCTATDQVQVVVNFSALTVAPGQVQFGGVVVNNTANAAITITNTGTLPETITAINGLSVPFTTNMVLPLTLPAGTSVQVLVAFNPTATLIYQNKVDLVTTAGTFNITIRGTGVNPAPAWTVTPASYNFGKVPINTNVTQIVVIRNTGNVPIRISSISSTSPRFVGSTSGILDLPVGESINMSVRFNPLAITAYTGSISIRSTTPGLALARAIVAGNGIIPGTPPELDFVNRPPFDGNGGVNPPVGNPGFYTYTVTYKSPNGLAPMAGFPKVGIDKNNDEDFVDDNEGLFSMEKEGTSTNWAAGVGYTFTTSLPVSELYGYQFFATDVNGNEANLTLYKKGPIVSREVLDLHIFASDIIFSKTNPAVNEDFTVTATINNNSPYAASEIPIRFYYKDSLFLFDDVIPFIGGRSKVSITKTLNFSPDGFYPIKVWIDSSNTLGEGNLLNNYASRPVIVGDFTVPGTIDLVSTATPSGCTKGRITFSGRATYRGLNLAGTPPVEGAEVTITIPGYELGRVLKTTTDINGNWYIYDDPCAQDINPEDCSGYQCGVTYNYTVEVTDFTLTSPLFASSVTRPCVPCDRVGRLRSGIGASACILENQAFTISGSLANYEYDFTTNRKLCAPSIYKDTITFYVDGQLVNTFIIDSLTTCGDAAFTHAATGLSVGNHQVSMNHVYYFANGDRVEESHSGGFVVLPIITDIEIGDGIIKTGHTSFVFGEKNKTCGVPAGPHTVYLYDSLPGYTEKVLIKTYTVASLLPDASIGFSYSNPDMETGNHYITAYTDEDGEIPELREDNNMMKAVFYVQEPDIVVEELNISSGAVIAGSLINFTAKISNAGSPIHRPFKVQFRVNGSLLGSSISIPSLETGESEVVVSAPFTVPVSLCPVEIVANADIDNEIVEVDEIKNNTDTTLFGVNINAGRSCFAEDEETVGAGFFNEEDIIGTIQCTPYIAPKGVLTYFATTVRNTGSRDVRNVRVQFKLEGEELGTDVIPLLKAGQKVESGFYYAFDTLGRFIINAFADYTREVCETNEKDNIGNIHVDIKRSVSDLEILSQYIAPSNLNPSPGQTITVVSSVVNKGDAPSTPTTMRFWVNDVQLGVDIPIDSLYPGMDTTVMATLTYASDIVGPKIVKVRADISNTVIERTKGNNEATRAIIVGAAPDFANAISEAITLSPASFNVGDEITIRNYIRNYGGDAGAAWMRFYYRNAAGEKILIDSLRFGLESNDSARISMKWKVTESAGQIITEIVGALPPEFNDQNNIDSLPFGVALPLTLLSFNGTVRNEEADLTWRTSSEINVKQFELERSSDGSRFEKVTIIKAINTSGQHDYRYTDAGFSKLMVPYVYYRLRMVDLDGSYQYSKVVRLVQPNLISTVKVYPNPVKDILQIQVQSVAAGDFTLRVVDAQGRLMLSRKYGVATGAQTLTLPVQTLAKGWYVLVMVQADGTMREVKIIKE